MDPAIDLDLHPPTVLCKRCQTFNLVEWFYPKSTARNASGLPSYLDLAVTLQNQKTCTFCAFIMCALALNPQFTLMEYGWPDLVEGRIFIYQIPIGTVSISGSCTWNRQEWPDSGREWQQKDQTSKRNVNSILLESSINKEPGRISKLTKMLKKTSSSISILPMCTGKEQVCDRLLHHPPHCRNKIDLNLVQEWLVSCRNHHQTTCSDSRWHDMGSTHLRMVDVREECIVQIKHEVEYFALSYCWGSSKQIRPLLQLNSRTQEYLERKGALSGVLSSLPQTIQDAIQLTRDLGCCYLWIDALCIVQDDSSHKMSQIHQMDKIYSHAVLTVVAAAGIDAWHGLPGVNEGTRLTRSLRQKVGDIEILAKWPTPYFPATIPPQWSWTTRGWTFQEQICSKRLLIFTDEEVMWDCNKELLAEGANPLSASGLSHVSVDLRQNRIIGMKPKSSSSPLQLYNFYLAGVSTRQIGYEEDKLNCATGLLNTLGAFFPSGFIWGLPIDIFDCAILFHCGVWDKAPFERRSMFPSWCWAAHKCHARSSIAGPYWSGFILAFKADSDSFRREESASWIRKETAFHHISEDGLMWEDLHSRQINEDGSVFYQTSVEQWQTSKPDMLLTEAKSRLDELKIPHDHALACFIQIIDLDVDRQSDVFHFKGPGISGASHGYNVRTPSPSRDYICGLQLTEDYRKEQPDKLTFILVAQQRRWEHLFGPLFELILVEQRCGLTFRIQSGCESVLTLNLWKQLTPRWEFVVLA